MSESDECWQESKTGEAQSGGGGGGGRSAGSLEEVRFELRHKYRVKPGMWVSGSQCFLQRNGKRQGLEVGIRLKKSRRFEEGNWGGKGRA